jgi:hypothetical protein
LNAKPTPIQHVSGVFSWWVTSSRGYLFDSLTRFAPLFVVIYTVFIVQACQTSQYVVSRGGVSLGKWRCSFAGSSDGKMNVQSACALNTRYFAWSSHGPQAIVEYVAYNVSLPVSFTSFILSYSILHEQTKKSLSIIKFSLS